VYLVGKLRGATSLYNLPGYQPDYSPATYLGTYGAYAAEFLSRPGALSWPALTALLAGSVIVAALTRRRVLLWAALFNVVAVLPIAFIPPRLGFAFYVPLTGWAVLLAGILDLACEFAVERIPAGARFSSGVRHAVARSILVVALAAVIVPHYMRASEARYYGAQDRQNRIRACYREIRYLLPIIPPRSRILLLHEPPNLDWTLNFVLPLGQQDRTVVLRTVRQLRQSDPLIRPAEYAFFLDYKDGHFRLASRSEVEDLILRRAL
jgi:hypothetical protein